MAEIVQRNVEGMLPELQELTRVRLFTSNETREILKKRKAHEYKLQRKSKCKEDFLNYIQYEIDVLALIKKRREETGYYFKKEEIEWNIVHRIHKIFKVARNRFRNDVKLWLSHIQFCQQWNQKTLLGRLFTEMLQSHTTKPDLWILAAKFQFEDNADPENARGLLQRGLRFNPSSKQLWLEYYRMELLFAEKLRLRREVLKDAEVQDEDSTPDAVLQGLVAAVVHKKAVEAFPGDVDFLLSFLPICKLFAFAHDQEEQIYATLQTEYADQPKTWDALAWRHLSRVNSSQNTESDVDMFYEIFDNAVTKVTGDEIWSLYINGCLEVLQFTCKKQLKTRRVIKTLDVFDQAAQKGALSENLYEKWLEVLTNVGLTEKIQEVLKAATSQHSTSSLLWKQRLQMMMKNSATVEDVIKVFNKACHHLCEKLEDIMTGATCEAENANPSRTPDFPSDFVEDTADLWQLLMEYCITNHSDSTDGLFQRGMSCIAQISGPLKELYIQWVFLTNGIKKTREVYKLLMQTRPIPLPVIKFYMDIENSQPNPKMKLLRQAYEDAVQEYGHINSDIWLEYIKMELTHPKGKPEHAGQLHFRALKKLEGELNQRFVTQYTLLQTGHVE